MVQVEPRYPEFPYDGADGFREALRSLCALWGRDPDNPFGDLIGPGGRAVIKPNWVRHYNPNGHDLDSLITHAALIKHVIDWVALAMDGNGSIVIGDAPLQSCDFAKLVERSRVGDVVTRAKQTYPNLDITIEDWRLTLMDLYDGFSEWDNPSRQSFRADYHDLLAQKYELVDLGAQSFLEEIADYADRFRVTCYKPSMMRTHHGAGKHEYLVTKRVFGPDLLINLPKMKTHMKAGLTGALKNLVGINGHKEYLAHHIKGSYFSGGDDYCIGGRLREWHDNLYDRVWEDYMTMAALKRRACLRALQLLWKAARVTSGDRIDAGSWSGNETIWRTTLDLNHILYFSPRSPRHILTLADGIIAGEGEGPLVPSPRPAGVLLGGENPAYIDATMARLMGYNVSRVPTVYEAVYHRKSRFAGPYLEEFDIACRDADGAKRMVRFVDLPNLRFVKPQHWKRADRAAAE
ncbi:MAG TPA: DUF362 domain-containing protein [Verrucomicrobiae bacterium]|nr:DUF362 domain-containing protein [Verrucomicrobiae bacterium]